MELARLLAMLGQPKTLRLWKKISRERFKITACDQFIQALWPTTKIFRVRPDCVLQYVCVFREYHRLRSRDTLHLDGRDGATQRDRDHSETGKARFHGEPSFDQCVILSSVAAPVMQLPGASAKETLSDRYTLVEYWGE
jgi:hypothetical protein